jgi:hypothetical protein
MNLVRGFPAQEGLQQFNRFGEPHGFLLQVNQTLLRTLLSDFKYFATDKSQLLAPIVQLGSLKNLGRHAIVGRLLIFDGIRNRVVWPVAGHVHHDALIRQIVSSRNVSKFAIGARRAFPREARYRRADCAFANPPHRPA